MRDPAKLRGMPRPRKPTITLPPYVNRVVSRGKDYYTYQQGRGTKRAGPRIKLPHPSDESFWPAYYAAHKSEPPKPGNGTFAALIQEYRTDRNPEWKALSPASKRDYGRYLDEIDRMWGTLRVDALEPRHVLKLRDKRADSPGAANYLLRVLSLAISWGVPRGYRTDNPCEHVRKLKLSDGWVAWPWEAIECVREQKRVELWWAAALALYTGQRESDDLAMKWSDVRDDGVNVIQEKTNTKLWIPLHKDLAAVLKAIPRRSINILTNSRGLPWTASGFRASWRKMMEDLEMPQGVPMRLVFHGLRKSAVVFLFEAGCTTAEVAAITGQSQKMVEHYSKQVNQKKLAAAAILKWENAK
jgi:integrase